MVICELQSDCKNSWILRYVVLFSEVNTAPFEAFVSVKSVFSVID